jgi:hypothetical protein
MSGTTRSRSWGRGLDFREVCLILVCSVLIFPHARAQSGAWTKKHDLPTPRSGASACVVDGKIYVIGGSGASYGDMATNELYDPVTDTWETKAPMPTPRGFLSTAVVNGIIFVLEAASRPPRKLWKHMIL